MRRRLHGFRAHRTASTPAPKSARLLAGLDGPGSRRPQQRQGSTVSAVAPGRGLNHEEHEGRGRCSEEERSRERWPELGATWKGSSPRRREERQGAKGRRSEDERSPATRPGLRVTRKGRLAQRRREMAPKSVAAAVDPSSLDAPFEIGIGIGIGIEPASSIRSFLTPVPEIAAGRRSYRLLRTAPHLTLSLRPLCAFAVNPAFQAETVNRSIHRRRPAPGTPPFASWRLCASPAFQAEAVDRAIHRRRHNLGVPPLYASASPREANRRLWTSFPPCGPTPRSPLLTQ